VTTGPAAPAGLPPAGQPGLDPAWSRLVEATACDGVLRTWHVLDNQVHDPVGTVLAVHGNPTWSYLWRSLLAQAPPGWRVVAPDHLGMGWSERVPHRNRLADRVADLGALTDALGVAGPVVTVGHDWGGSISLGWALAHRDRLIGVVLTNTAVSQPPATSVPRLIRVARTRPALTVGCVGTTAFLDGTLRLAHPQLSAAVRAAYRAPYLTPSRRAAIGWFVEDIPLEADHPSRRTLDGIADGLGALSQVPTLVLWGPRDPVFAERYLRDLVDRLPHAQVHRFEGAGHLVAEDDDVAGAVAAWLPTIGGPPEARPAPVPVSGRRPSRLPTSRRPLWAGLDERADDLSPAVVELSPGGHAVSWARLAAVTRNLAAGMVAHGVRPGDRVGLLVPPGADLTAAAYACWRAGAVVVVADAGLGRRGLSRALTAANPRHLVGIPRALAAARALGWPGSPVLAGRAGPGLRRLLGAGTTLADLARLGRWMAGTAGAARLPDPPGPEAEAAVLFTSGATGPAKGVVYLHGQLEAQRDLVASTYGVTERDRLVAAFAPFALYGPALGVASAVPAMDVTAPATLTAAALAEAVAAVDATLLFGSPAALAGVVATADDLAPRQAGALRGVRLVLSAGAPVPVDLLRRVAELTPNAQLHTPYGMTEVLPVTDVSLAGLLDAAADAGRPAGGGVCVGRPVEGVVVGVAPLDEHGDPEPTPVDKPFVTGEICVVGPHVKQRYDSLWLTELRSVAESRWHRTGDVGHLDDRGRLWVEGRLAHVVRTAGGVITPVGVEQLAELLPAVGRAAAVGVGPPGAQVVVVVVEPVAGDRRVGPSTFSRSWLADVPLADDVRAAVRPAVADVAAVLEVPALPVDIRHNSKVDRTRLAVWAGRVLSGARTGAP
jgi:olefin beta-lactone synthetase